jgi:DNA-binding NtrC family response regulator
MARLCQGNLEAKFEVEVATNLKTVLAKLQKDRYDLIIASSRHLDVLEAISTQYPEKRVVVATGQPTTREAITIYRLGTLNYFAKDFRREVVLKKIYEAIQKPVKAPAS